MDRIMPFFGIGRAQLKLLFIKLKHIGDALLMTPTLVAARAQYPDAEIHVVVRSGSEGILQGCPAVDQIHTAAPPAGLNRISSFWCDFELALILRRHRFDMAIELGEGSRGRLLARTSNASIVHTNSPEDEPRPGWVLRGCPSVSRISAKRIHQVEKDYRVVNAVLTLPPEPVPPLCFNKKTAQPWTDSGPLIVFHPATRWKRKKWPIDKWIQLGRLLSNTHDILVSCGPDPDERREAAHIAEEIGPSAQSSDGKLNWAQLAGALYHAKLFVGVDTAAMHLAAACQCPTVAIFGPSRSWAWAPWRTQYKIIGPSDQQWADAAEGDIDAFLKTIIQSMPVSHVFDACEELLAPSPTQILVNPENSN